MNAANRLNKLNHLESLLEHIRDDGSCSQQEKETRYDLVEQSIGAFVKYHNEAVEQGAQITMARIRFSDDFDRFSDYVSNLHERRKELHKAMIDHTSILNQMCQDAGIPDIYTGPLDQGKGRDDPDTRFGVAGFCEEVCRDLFKATETLYVPSKAHEAFKDHARRLESEGGGWNALQRMLAHADAQAGMDVHSYEDQKQ